MAYVYAHYKADNEELFYIGISRNKNDDYERLEDYNKRSKFWKDIVKLHGFSSKVLFDNITWDEACTKEIELVALYGRRDLGTGILCNLTKGGDGCEGWKVTEEYRQKMSKIQKNIQRPDSSGKNNPFYGKHHTEESKQKRLDTLKKNGTLRKGENHPHFGKKLTKEQQEKRILSIVGKKHSEEHKRKISEGGKGILKTEEWKEKRRGSNNKSSKKCIFMETNEIFSCLREVCEVKNLVYANEIYYIKSKSTKQKIKYL